MSLDDLATRSLGRTWQECGVHYALRVLPNDRATVLLAALDNPAASHTAIANALGDEVGDWMGMPDGTAVGRHRAGKCKCGRDQ